MLLKTLAAAFAACLIAFGAQAQDNKTLAKTITRVANDGNLTTVKIPPQFMAIFNGYRGWKTEYPQIDYSNSISNWAYKTKQDFSAVIIAAARNWLFMQTEERFAALVNGNAADIKTNFGDIYLASGVHIVFSSPFTEEVDRKYLDWFFCKGQTKWDNYSGATLIDDRVLTQLNNGDPIDGLEHECKMQYMQLSQYYGVSELTAEDLHAIGFLSRRHLANQKNPKFLKAEFIRKTIGELFDPNN